MVIAFIGFGGAGYGLTKGLKQAGVDPVYFFDTHWNTPPFGTVISRRAAETGAVRAESIPALLASAETVISCVTGVVAVSVAEQSAPYLSAKHLYVDVNTAAPTVMETVASVVEKTGAGFADAAMMGAIPAFLHRVPILVSGGGAETFKQRMQPYGMDITCVGDKPGQASAIKMFRSIFMKGFLALLLEMLPATHRFGVDDLVLNSIAQSMEKHPFLETVRLQVSKGVVNAARMAHEMEDVLQTLKDMEMPAVMTPAVMEKLRWCERLDLKTHYGGELPEDTAEIMDALLARTALPADQS